MKTSRWIIIRRVLLAVFLATVLSITATGLYLHSHPDKLRSAVEHIINNALPNDMFSAGNIAPVLWPEPGICMTEVLLYAPDGTALYADEVEIRLSWLHMLHGKIAPSTLELTRPAAVIRLPQTDSPQSYLQTVKKNNVFQNSTTGWLSSLGGMEVVINDGHLALYAKNPNTLQHEKESDALAILSGISGAMRMPGILLQGHADLTVSKLSLNTDNTTGSFPFPKELQNIEVRLSGLKPADDALLRPQNLYISFAAGEHTAYGDIQAAARLRFTDSGAEGELSILGHLDKNGMLSRTRSLEDQAVPLSILLPFTLSQTENWTDIPSYIQITDGTLRLGADSLSISAEWHPETGIQGKADVSSLSLPRWFGFARALPNGLATALDKLSGSMSFTLTDKTLDVNSLTVFVAGVTLQGHGSVKDFSNPVIAIDVSAPAIDMNKIMPEIAGKTSPRPVYSGQPLSFGTTKGKAPGYNICIQADKATFWKLQAERLRASIAPRGNTPSLTIDATRFYEGTLHQELDFASRLGIRTTIKKTNSQKLVQALGGASPVLGELNVKASMTAPRGTIGHILTQLNGSLEAEVIKGTIKTKSQTIPFQKVGVSFAGKGISTTDGALPPFTLWDGNWLITADMNAPFAPKIPLNTSLELNGTLSISSANALPVYGNALSAKLTGKAMELPLDLTGQLNFSLPEKRFSINNLRGSAGELNLMGTAFCSFELPVPTWEIQSEIHCAHLREILRRVDMLPEKLPKSALHKFTMQGKIKNSTDSIQIDIPELSIDSTSCSAKLNRDAAHLWNVEIRLGKINMDTYLPFTASSDKAASHILPSGWMNTYKAHGVLYADQIILARIPQTNVTIPFSLANGELSVSPVTSACLDGNQLIKLRARALQPGPDSTGMQLSLNYNSKNINMEKLTRLFTPGVLLQGKSDFAANIEGDLSSLQHPLQALTGHWTFSMGPGRYAQINPRSKKVRSGYDISGITASGALNHGIIICENMNIFGPRLKVNGHGNINLIKNSINYKLNAAVPGLPNIPISYTGKLDDPTRSINLLSVFTGVLGEIGNSALSIFDDIITSPLRLFK